MKKTDQARAMFVCIAEQLAIAVEAFMSDDQALMEKALERIAGLVMLIRGEVATTR